MPRQERDSAFAAYQDWGYSVALRTRFHWHGTDKDELDIGSLVGILMDLTETFNNKAIINLNDASPLSPIIAFITATHSYLVPQ